MLPDGKGFVGVVPRHGLHCLENRESGFRYHSNRPLRRSIARNPGRAELHDAPDNCCTGRAGSMK
jgi:hypothetical protein